MLPKTKQSWIYKLKYKLKLNQKLMKSPIRLFMTGVQQMETRFGKTVPEKLVYKREMPSSNTPVQALALTNIYFILGFGLIIIGYTGNLGTKVY